MNKSFILLLAVVGIIFTSCNSSSDSNPSNIVDPIEDPAEENPIDLTPQARLLKRLKLSFGETYKTHMYHYVCATGSSGEEECEETDSVMGTSVFREPNIWDWSNPNVIGKPFTFTVKANEEGKDPIICLGEEGSTTGSCTEYTLTEMTENRIQIKYIPPAGSKSVLIYTVYK